jgi:hypothetical protein
LLRFQPGCLHTQRRVKCGHAHRIEPSAVAGSTDTGGWGKGPAGIVGAVDETAQPHAYPPTVIRSR